MPEKSSNNQLNIVQPEQAAKNPAHYVDIDELASRLSLSKRTIYTYINDADDPMPAYRIGRKILCFWPEIQDWIKRHKVITVDMDAMVDQIISNSGKE